MTELTEEIRRRLTFAIISHPDAGKTTITEKILLFGGAIHIAGAVKSGKNTRAAVSDFMAMEQERGISISSSVMGFEYGNRKINLLDTPGHADFSEDTYRGLSAVDSALMVIDSVKGVEERTRKLCEICRMRATPIITFINKLDREGKEPMEVLDEVERELATQVRPLTWPIGQGRAFKGVFNLLENNVYLFHAGEVSRPQDVVALEGSHDPRLDSLVGERLAGKLRDDLELLRGVYPPFSVEEYLAGLVSPVFFGSALNNFGVRELLDAMVSFAPWPTPKEADERTVQPDEEKFTGFIFKIHANMNPKHRDRVAFLRICSGKFERNKTYFHVRAGKPFRTANPTAFMSQDREIIDEAWPGDIIGLHDTGTFKIGDTLTEGETVNFKGIPSFSPQIFRVIVNADPLKEKQFHKGLNQLAEEGVVQIFSKPHQANVRVLGVVGQLQLEVLQYRLQHEYGASLTYRPLDYSMAHWFNSADPKLMAELIDNNTKRILVDIRGNYAFLSDSEWSFERAKSNNPAIHFYSTSEMKDRI
ncbi:MAG: peptide chain release factor 3 [Spirochaetes bacterium GWD1_61_31]|nr:MAG: peptide chain release factor 3 [Spirochaetes bacterium GWB1_60_80]OHD31496.1 MAG: peptide chain release factor 3 [Spirochaetes bacterium GWC1_61_12]OHD43272.1 MAG: peptide chain release factor 3 [Spirochaetes bacterium GWD1_61_31]OHD45638.1 MAG: peptide chain release factor 3 [Spirochaetes bacterium GWE1_60_18]OHD60489.1 MAG: peptide chain release factor 3 [Spirochaetes bacterium GWF1_60_12]HAP44708.1 peptide chain release factor 3 [Spirochaetaceae bacterium]